MALSRPICFGKRARGSFYLYENAVATTIDVTDTYHAVLGFLENSGNIGLTYLASAAGSITDTASNGGILRCTDVEHGLTTGQIVTLTGMGNAAHNGVTAVTVISADVFDCDDIAYSSDDDTGNWSRGTSMTVSSGYQGEYFATFNASLTSAGNLKNYRFEIFVNASAVDEIACERMIATGGDWGVISSSGPINLSAGDIVWLAAKNTTDDTNLTIRHGSLSLVKSN